MKIPSKAFVSIGQGLLLCTGLSMAVCTAEPDNAAGALKPGTAEAGDAARSPQAGFAGGPGMGRERFEAFKQADADDDRKLSFPEFSGMQRLAGLDEPGRRKLFDFLDRDQDGFLQMSETRPREPRWMSVAQNEFDRLDVDGDGALSAAEFAELPRLLEKKKMPFLFKKMDRNQNDKIERDELRPLHQASMRPEIPFARHDANASGGLDYEEYSSMPWMLKWPEPRRKNFFDKVDTDGDGEISEAEIRNAHMKREKHGFKHQRHQHGKPPHKHAIPDAGKQPAE